MSELKLLGRSGGLKRDEAQEVGRSAMGKSVMQDRVLDGTCTSSSSQRCNRQAR